VVAFSIPEQRRHLRDSFRTKLAWLGFGTLSNGVWISPHDVRAEVRAIATELKIHRHLELFRGTHEGFSNTKALVDQCWNLDELNLRYAAFIKRWEPELGHCAQCGMTGVVAAIHRPCTSPADCFRRRFMLVHEYRAFPMEDPYLPRPLLPTGWLGDKAAKLFDTYHDVLTEPAERYVAEVCRQGDIAHAA
jgi:phenylacetic acid degradation operon negative regulatory protein